MAPLGDTTAMFRPTTGKSATAVGPGHRYFAAEDQTPGCARSNTEGPCACATETQAAMKPIAIDQRIAWPSVCNLTAQISRAASRRRLHLLVRVAQFRGDPYA